MTSFLSIESYSSLLVFFFGLLTYLGFAGTGMAILRLCRINFPFPWFWVAGTLTGIQVGSLLVQVVAMAGIASKWMLIAVWLFMLVVGLIFLISEGSLRRITGFSLPGRLTLFIAVPVILAISANFVAALAPSTKIDELYYHMLLPSRIVNDHALVFYRYPIESAALPHMIYQFSLTPLHAIGFPDSGNVVSLGLSLTLIIFGWHLIRRHGGSRAWAWLWTAMLCVGMYPVVWQVTGGASAMGDLAMASAILALFLRKELLEKMATRNYFLLVSIFVLGSVSTKISLLPSGLCLLLINLLILFRTISRNNERTRILCLMSVPWLIFYLPILIWTWKASGSPFGPFLAGKWGVPSIYPLDQVYYELRQMKEVNLPTVQGALKAAFIDYTPLLWGGLLMLFLGKAIGKMEKIMAILLVFLQLIVVLGFLVFDMRYFGGMIQGLVLVFAVTATAETRGTIQKSRLRIIILAVLFLFPWVIIQLYYSAQFAGVVSGLQPKTEFYRTKTSFFDDYRNLDRLLPKNAGIMFCGPLRFNLVYAPRAVYLTEADIPPGKPVFLMVADGNPKSGDPFGRYRLREEVYENKTAIAEIFRTPGIPPRIRHLKVFSMALNPD